MTEVPSRTAIDPHDRGTQQLLEVISVSMRFGGIVALDDVNFAVSKGRIVGLIGPNGAGKTTLFNCLSRLYQPERGDIRLNGKSLLDSTSSDIAGSGIGRTFQNPALFASMTVLDNVRVGAHARGRNGPLSDAVTLPRFLFRIYMSLGRRVACVLHRGSPGAPAESAQANARELGWRLGCEVKVGERTRWATHPGTHPPRRVLLFNCWSPADFKPLANIRKAPPDLARLSKTPVHERFTP
jgi:ABC-type sugar transport system ATPase subunit